KLREEHKRDPLMIDSMNGQFTCDDLTIAPSVGVGTLLALPGVTSFSIAGNVHVRLGARRCGGLQWGISAICSAGRLEKVLLQILDEDESDWSLAREERRQQTHNSYLRHCCTGGRSEGDMQIYRFSWGR